MFTDETETSVVAEETTSITEETTFTEETTSTTEETTFTDETTTNSDETNDSDYSPYIPEVTVSDDTVFYDVSLFIPEYGNITGTISETRTAEILRSLDELKKSQQMNNSLISILSCVLCLLIGAVCGLLLTLHIKRR